MCSACTQIELRCKFVFHKLQIYSVHLCLNGCQTRMCIHILALGGGHRTLQAMIEYILGHSHCIVLSAFLEPARSGGFYLVRVYKFSLVLTQLLQSQPCASPGNSANLPTRQQEAWFQDSFQLLSSGIHQHRRYHHPLLHIDRHFRLIAPVVSTCSFRTC